MLRVVLSERGMSVDRGKRMRRPKLPQDGDNPIAKCGPRERGSKQLGRKSTAIMLTHHPRLERTKEQRRADATWLRYTERHELVMNCRTSS